jgi:hypothetical protein
MAKKNRFSGMEDAPAWGNHAFAIGVSRGTALRELREPAS